MRRVPAIACAAFFFFAPHAQAAPRVTPDDLVKAAQAASLSDVDERRRACNDERRVGDWLKAVVGGSAKSIRWSGGRCVLAIKERPRDAGTNWCAHAEIAPKNGRHASTIEIYFEPPKQGRLGAPFAFRSLIHTKDGPDYGRETGAFATNWGETYIAGYKPPEAGDCD